LLRRFALFHIRIIAFYHAYHMGACGALAKMV
jgi:hypothetical protein